MFFLLILFSVLSALLSMPIGESNSCGFPNGTDRALHYYLCSENEQFRIDNITVTNSEGEIYYPIDPKIDNTLYLYTYNNGDQIEDNKSNVKLYDYTNGWTGHGECAWSLIPTYGLLNNIDGCEFAHNCPLAHGDLVLVLPLDLERFSPIINAIAAYKPYQLEIRIYNWNSNQPTHPEIACVMVQLEMS